MKILDWKNLVDLAPKPVEPVALTIGVFDGLHIGHQRLIKAVVNSELDALSVVISFRQNPVQVLGHGRFRGNLLSMRQKLHNLEALGVAQTVLIDFSYEFSTLSGRQFIELLKKIFNLQKMVVGRNFTFGRARDTDVNGLKELIKGTEIELEVIPPSFYRNEVVSSSRIREAILAGDFSGARDMLGRDYLLDLAAVGEIHREKGKYRVPIRALSQILPKEGKYRVRFIDGKKKKNGLVEIDAGGISWEEKVSKTSEILFIAQCVDD